jgi:hypothetical protein
MKKNKLLLLLSTFSKKEIEQFTLFLSSPYYNNQEVFSRLFSILKPILLSKAIDLTGEETFKKLFPKKQFDAKHLSNYTSRLLSLAQQFLGIEAAAKEKHHIEALELKELSKRGLAKHFKSTYSKAEKRIKKEKLSLDSYLHQYQLKYIEHEFKQANQEKITEKNLQAIFNDFDSYIILKKISLVSEKIAYENAYSFSLQSAFLDDLDKLVEKSPFKDIFLIQTYYHAYKMYTDIDADEAFFILKKLLIQEQTSLAKRELNELLTIAANYALKQTKKGKNLFLKETLVIYDLMERNQVLFQSQVNPFARFRNAIFAACQQREFEWLASFIERSVQLLDEKYQKTAYHFGFGYYYFYQKRFNEATEHLRHTYDVSEIDSFYEMNRRYLYIRSIYEMDKDYKTNSIDTFQVFKDWIKRQNKAVSKQYIDSFITSTSLLMTLYRVKLDRVGSRYNTKMKREKILEKVKSEIIISSLVVPKEWYLEKVEELQGVRK